MELWAKECKIEGALLPRATACLPCRVIHMFRAGKDLGTWTKYEVEVTTLLKPNLCPFLSSGLC